MQVSLRKWRTQDQIVARSRRDDGVLIGSNADQEMQIATDIRPWVYQPGNANGLEMTPRRRGMAATADRKRCSSQNQALVLAPGDWNATGREQIAKMHQEISSRSFVPSGHAQRRRAGGEFGATEQKGRPMQNVAIGHHGPQVAVPILQCMEQLLLHLCRLLPFG